MSLLLPEKEYYCLEDVASRWQISLADLSYYVTHGLLEVMIYLDQGIVNVSHMKTTIDGETFPVATAVMVYKDYVILAPDDLRRVFRGTSCQVRKFTPANREELLEIHESQEGYRVTIDDLVISRTELDRFETRHSDVRHNETDGNGEHRTLSVGGRPNTTHRVRQHFMERRDQGKIFSSLQREADYLVRWARDNIKDGPLPKINTIRNAIRADYRQCTKSTSVALDKQLDIEGRKPVRN